MKTVPELMVSLVNGTQVPWSEFKTWSHQKQAYNIISVSHETRAKRSAALKGKPRSANHAEKIRQSKIGKPRSAETKAKISAAQRAKLHVAKPIMTPSGVFPTVQDAVAYAKAQGLKNPRNKLYAWLKTHPDQYYFLPQDTK